MLFCVVGIGRKEKSAVPKVWAPTILFYSSPASWVLARSIGPVNGGPLAPGHYASAWAERKRSSFYVADCLPLACEEEYDGPVRLSTAVAKKRRRRKYLKKSKQKREQRKKFMQRNGGKI